MNKQELIARVAAECNTSKLQAGRLVDSIFDNIVKAVARGNTFQLVGFGTLKTAKRGAHQSRNPLTGKIIQVPAKVSPKFVPGKAFKDAVAK